jgi:glycine/D-amino acid oxidase-like deaminating enzyme
MVGKGSDDSYESTGYTLVRDAGLPIERLTSSECKKRFPQINFGDIAWALYEESSGYLMARQSCQAVLDAFVEAGGDYLQRQAKPAKTNGRISGLSLSSGEILSADLFVFACGPWLGRLFPDLGERFIRPTRQEIFYFGTPPGDSRFLDDSCPVWAENGNRLFYGIPGNEFRGFKLADDTRGDDFDPTNGERVPSEEGLQAAREYLGLRFPDMKGAPLVEARVCQYENSRDEHFIVDQHPDDERVWILGGGSGHGFKHGPALGERVAEQVLGEREKDAFFSLGRFG